MPFQTLIQIRSRPIHHTETHLVQVMVATSKTASFRTQAMTEIKASVSNSTLSDFVYGVAGDNQPLPQSSLFRQIYQYHYYHHFAINRRLHKFLMALLSFSQRNHWAPCKLTTRIWNFKFGTRNNRWHVAGSEVTECDI